MKNFGFTIQHNNSIDYDINDKRMMHYVAFHEPSINWCIGCGSCTATCSTGHFTFFNIKQVHTLLRRGETGRLKQEIKKCMFCGKCQLACPRGVNLRNVLLTINRAIEQIG
jgi:heterodisulfide reductase subunit C